jgi:D-isomer specific 2-hydroxyacid dehydrogenase, NAD binding domain
MVPLGAEAITAMGAVKVELDDLLAQSDFVSVHRPRTEETLGMFGFSIPTMASWMKFRAKNDRSDGCPMCRPCLMWRTIFERWV